MISRRLSYRNVAIETKSRRLQLLASDGSDGDDMFVLSWGSSQTSLATSTGDAFSWFGSDVNGFSLNEMEKGEIPITNGFGRFFGSCRLT